MDRELDDLLRQLRNSSPPDRVRRDFDRVLRDRLASQLTFDRPPRLHLSFQCAAVAAAFVVGLAVGVTKLPGVAAEPQALLVDVMDP